MTTPGLYNKKIDPIPTPVHYTISVFDIVNREWNFYNSIRPRGQNPSKRDHYFANAKEVIADAEKVWHNMMDDSFDANHWARTLKHPVVYQKNSPQQMENSADCAVIVMYIMNRYITGDPILKIIGEEAVIDFKVEILSTIINDPFFWNYDSYMESRAYEKLVEENEGYCEIVGKPISELDADSTVANVLISLNSEHKTGSDYVDNE